MRKFVLAGAMFLSAALSTGVAHAQPMGHERFMVRLDQLNLSDQQWLAIHKIMVANHANGKAVHRAEHELWRGFHQLNPDAADYQTQVQALQAQAARLAEQRVAALATLKQQIYGVLSDSQKAQLAALPQPDRDGPSAPNGE